MTIDNIISKVNQKSVFKLFAFLVLSFPSFQNFGQLQSILVAVVTPNHTCQFTNPSTNFSISPDQCIVNVNGSQQKCSKWNFSQEPVGRTMVSDYGLVCDKKGYGDVILIVWYVTAFTAIVMGWLSDTFGRKKIAILNLTIETVSSILLAFAPNVYSNMVLRFFIGISANGVYVVYVWVMELVDFKFRDIVGSFFWMYGCLAYMLFPLIIYLTKNWRITQLVSIIPSILYLLIFLIPESPRWLCVKGRRKEAAVSIKKICKMNKINIILEGKDIIVINRKEKGDHLSAFRSSIFLFRLGLIFLLQFSIFLFYLGITMNISILSKRVLLSMFLMGLMETPGLFLSFFSLHYLKRKFSLLTFGGIGSTLFWISVFFKQDVFWQSIVRIILGCIGKATIASVNQSTMVYVAELFPTSHRSFSFVFLQLANFLAFLGAIYINKLSNTAFFIPMTTYFILMWTSCLLAYFLLPETKGLPLPDTLEDQKHLNPGKEGDYLIYMENKRNEEYNCTKDLDEKLPLEKNEENSEKSSLIKKTGY